MDDDDLVTHLAVGNFDPPPPSQPNYGCFWTIISIIFFALLAILL